MLHESYMPLNLRDNPGEKGELIEKTKKTQSKYPPRKRKPLLSVHENAPTL
jgi:hypothetical protein